MKKHGVISILLLILLCLSMISPVVTATQADSVGGGSNSCQTIDAQVALLGSEQLVKNIRSAFIYEMNSDTLMYAYNPDEPEEPASLVKVMTALVAIEQGNLDDMVTVKESVIKPIPKKTISAKLVADEVISFEDLLYCLLVGSASDAAAVVADHVSGSQEAFVELMNIRAEEIGCTGTVFKNAHGLFHKDQVTTARDSAKIIKEALKNEKFAEIFGTAYYTVEATNKSEARNLATNNFLMSQHEVRLYYDTRVTGGRSGVTEDGTRSIASTADFEGMKLICVVMGSASEYRDDSYAVRVYGGFPETISLLDICYNQYKTVHVIYDGQILTQRPVTNGANQVSLCVNTSVLTVLPRNITSKQLKFQYKDKTITAPVEAGEHLSSVEIWYNDLCVGNAELYAVSDVAVAGTLECDVKKSSMGIWWLLALIPLAAAVFFAWKYRRRIRRSFRIFRKRFRRVFGDNRRSRRR